MNFQVKWIFKYYVLLLVEFHVLNYSWIMYIQLCMSSSSYGRCVYDKWWCVWIMFQVVRILCRFQLYASFMCENINVLFFKFAVHLLSNELWNCWLMSLFLCKLNRGFVCRKDQQWDDFLAWLIGLYLSLLWRKTQLIRLEDTG